MVDFIIREVTARDGQLSISADHFDADGAFWFREEYTWQGREAFKRKKALDPQGRVLMDDGQPAPTRPVVGGMPGDREAFLPPGRSWRRESIPRLKTESILITIRSIHRQRQNSGWPVGDFRGRSIFKGSPEDLNGAPLLRSLFRGLQEFSE